MPQDFVTTERFKDHIEDHNKLEMKVSDLNKEMGTKVSWVVFWSIVLLLVGVASATFSVLYVSIKEVQKTGIETQNGVTYIKGVLDTAEITK